MTQHAPDNLGCPTKSGSLSELVTVSEETTPQPVLSRETWRLIIVLGLVFVAAHYWQWVNLLPVWISSPDWQHGLVIPLISVYLIWVNRDKLRQIQPRICRWGLAIMALAVLMESPIRYAGRPFISSIGMVFLLFGVVLFLGGPRVIRTLWLPILFWCLAMPWPALVYNNLAFGLQNLAASSTGTILGSWFPIDVSGSTMVFNSVSGHECNLEVSGKCSGVHSLMAYVALGVAMAYLEDRALWQRLTLLVFIVPVAILTNILRVVITALMYYTDHPQLGEDFMHTLTGLLMIVPTFLILWGISGILKRLFVEVEEDTPSATEGKPA